MAPYVAAWVHAHRSMLEVMDPHMEDSYVAYLIWFRSRTRVRVSFIVDPQPCIRMTHDMFPPHCSQTFADLISYHATSISNFMSLVITKPQRSWNVCSMRLVPSSQRRSSMRYSVGYVRREYYSRRCVAPTTLMTTLSRRPLPPLLPKVLHRSSIPPTACPTLRTTYTHRGSTQKASGWLRWLGSTSCWFMYFFYFWIQLYLLFILLYV
jgi:hypothetical protein